MLPTATPQGYGGSGYMGEKRRGNGAGFWQSVSMTWIYKGTGGSVILAGILFHLTVNSTISLEVGS